MYTEIKKKPIRKAKEYFCYKGSERNKLGRMNQEKRRTKRISINPDVDAKTGRNSGKGKEKQEMEA